MKSPYWDVTITGRSDATVNGVPVEMVVPTNVYSSVFQHLATAARQAGRPVLARGVDETRGGRVSWFTVDAEGQAAAAQPPPAASTGGRPPAPSRAALPRPRRAPSAHPGASEPQRDPVEPTNEPSPARALARPESQMSAPSVPASPARACMSEPESTVSPVPPDAPPPESPRQPASSMWAGPPRQLEGPKQSEVPKAPPRAISPTMPPRQAPPGPRAQRPDSSSRQGPSQSPPHPKSQELSPPPASPDVPFRSISMNVPPSQTPPVQEPSPSSLLVRPPKTVPQGGFRGAMYRLTSGRVNFGPSQTQIRLAERDSRISRSLERPYSTVFLSFKGGIGKTSTAVGVGLALAQARGVPPIAIDADPDSGDLAERLLGEEEMLRVRPRSITDLVQDIPNVRTWTDLSGYITQVDRLHVVAGEQDPAVSDSLTAEGYKRVHDLVQNFFSVILTDCGTGVTHNAMSGILSKADSVVIATGYAFSGVKRAVSTIDWLSQHGYEKLAQEAIVVLTDKDNVSIRVQKDMVRTHLATHSRQVFVVPNDPAVADGDRINLERVQPRTREAWAEVAAALIDGYQ
mgnify:FL=1